MAEPVTWPAEPHTLAKHAILRRYLGAWFGILPSGSRRVVYIDGFAGPGRYDGREPGSPLIALEAAREHAEREAATEFVFLFVESDPRRAANLEGEIGGLALPRNIRWSVVRSEFATTLTRALDELDRAGHPNAPIFAFVDPFGIEGFPFSLIARLLARPRTEVLITFMTNWVKRFAGEWSEKLPEVLGDAGGASGILAIDTPKDRIDRIRSVYAASLGRIADFVRYFTMQDRAGNTIYDLFFATKHRLGHLRMKEAMRGVGQGREYQFMDGLGSDQLALFGDHVPHQLAEVLVRNYAGKEIDAAEVKRYTEDRTAYIGTDFTAAMRLLEAGTLSGLRIDVASTKADGSRRNKGTFPPGARVRFPPAP
jgi:three-Cys-motif partner protein